MTSHAANLVAIASISLPATFSLPATNLPCECDAGDYWCATDGFLRWTLNCSASDEAQASWKAVVNADTPTTAQCEAVTMLCDGQAGAHGTPLKNATCDDSCYDWCWRKPAGDCADDDDSQMYCVGSCMAYCVSNQCEQPMVWSPCQESCAKAHMEAVPPVFIDYSNCMAKCTPVPVSPWGLEMHAI